MYQWAYRAEKGGFIGYGPSEDLLADVTARFAASLLRGTMPADLPVEQPTKCELAINLNTAKAMGVTVPSALLLRADKLIELPMSLPAHGPIASFRGNAALQSHLE
jgi:putative ABC transport system substrate-binding protein